MAITKRATRRPTPQVEGRDSERLSSEFPKFELTRAITIAQTIEDNNGGNPMPPTDIAISLGVSPGSSSFRILLSAAYKYGLTLGSYRQDRITLTDLGRAIVLPTSESHRNEAERQAAITPPVFKSVFEHFKGKKLPEGVFFENTVVREFGIPREQATRCIEVFRANLERVGLLREANTGVWVASDVVSQTTKHESAVGAGSERTGETDPEVDEETEVLDVGSRASRLGTRLPFQSMAKSDTQLHRVFVSHGQSRELVPQLKELLTFGQFDPVVSVERETVSKPIPDKVMDDMRSCGAAIIHVDAEQELLTPEGERHFVLNQNVLIEIGAALALYRRRFILLVKNGVKLPTNLQGLYEVRYQGDRLDGDATLRLLKAFNDFKSETVPTA